MADLIQDGLDFLAEQLVEHCSQASTYARGAASVTWNVVPQSRHKIGDDEFCDFCGLASELILSGSATVPAQDDTITFDSNTWTVYPPEAEDQGTVYHYVDPGQTMILVHAIL